MSGHKGLILYDNNRKGGSCAPAAHGRGPKDPMQGTLVPWIRISFPSWRDLFVVEVFSQMERVLHAYHGLL